MENTKLKGGLNELIEDARDIRFGELFTQVDPATLPSDFDLGDQPVKLQDDDSCTQQAMSLASQFQEGVELDPYYTFAYVKQNDPDKWGSDLRSAAKGQCELGAIEIKDNTLSTEDRKYFDKYPLELKDKAAVHKKKTYVFVKGRYDAFDDIRTSMWRFRNEKRAVVFGVMWVWALNEYILNGTSHDGFGHAICCRGWATFDGKPYLKIQNSYGKEAGLNGIHLMSRETINEFVERYGAIMFTDFTKEELRLHIQKGTPIDTNFLRRLIIRLWN